MRSYNLALVLLQQLPDEAEAWVRPLVAKNPNDADALTVLGGALHAQARIDEAISAMGRSGGVGGQPDDAQQAAGGCITRKRSRLSSF